MPRRRQKHRALAEIMMSPQTFKLRNSIESTVAELKQVDPTFKKEVVGIMHEIGTGRLNMKAANDRYFMSIDAAVRRRQKALNPLSA